jgi:hypothetical protein
MADKPSLTQGLTRCRSALRFDLRFPMHRIVKPSHRAGLREYADFLQHDGNLSRYLKRGTAIEAKGKPLAYCCVPMLGFRGSSRWPVPMTLSSYAHRFIAASNPARRALVLLHGSGGSEHDLVPLAEELAPGSPILAIRGDVEIDDGHAFLTSLPRSLCR